jgi:type VI secretion system secreted protein VgrG
MSEEMEAVREDATAFVQERRFLRVSSALGEDALLLTGVEGVDLISKPFLFRIEFATRLSESRVLKLLGKPMTLWIGHTAETAARPVNGLVRKLSGPLPGLRAWKYWRAELVPQFAFLDYTADCRIFQNKSVVEIIDDVFAIHGLLHYEKRNLMGSYPKLDYCVQYRESAMNFVSRLMEHSGLFFWFEHGADRHNLVIADMTKAALPATPEVLLMPDRDQFAPVQSLASDYEFRPGIWTLKDYNFETPTAPLQASTPTNIFDPVMTEYEVFDYPGIFNDITMATDLSRIRTEYEEARFHRLQGASTVALLDSGRVISIMIADQIGYRGPDEEQNFFLLGVTHHARDMTQITGSAPPPEYSNEFTVVPADAPFRPERVSRKPLVQGPQTATVSGPPGEEIFTDEFGRVKVRFHWDRNPEGLPDEDRSCWLRVSQSWANSSWGSVHIPRIGEEVIVEFLEGDPDRPIITGRVYNGDNDHPYGLPANKTQSGFKSNSVGGTGFNEWRFEDRAGSEEIYIHAQRDHTHDVGHDHTHNVGHNHVHNVNNDYNVTIQNDWNVTVNNNVTTNTTATASDTSATKVSATGAEFTTAGTHMAGYGFSFTAAALNIAVYGLYIQIPGATITLTPLKLDMVGIKIDEALVKIANKPVEIEQVGLSFKKKVANAKTYGMTFEQIGTKLQTVGTKIINAGIALFS